MVSRYFDGTRHKQSEKVLVNEVMVKDENTSTRLGNPTCLHVEQQLQLFAKFPQNV